jgi:hypothetical protein
MTRLSPENCVPADILGRFHDGLQRYVPGVVGIATIESEVMFDTGALERAMVDPEDTDGGLDVRQQIAVASLRRIWRTTVDIRDFGDGQTTKRASIGRPGDISLGVTLGSVSGRHTSLGVKIRVPGEETMVIYDGAPNPEIMQDGLNLDEPLGVGESDQDWAVRNRLGRALVVVASLNDTLRLTGPTGE